MTVLPDTTNFFLEMNKLCNSFENELSLAYVVNGQSLSVVRLSSAVRAVRSAMENAHKLFDEAPAVVEGLTPMKMFKNYCDGNMQESKNNMQTILNQSDSTLWRGEFIAFTAISRIFEDTMVNSKEA